MTREEQIKELAEAWIAKGDGRRVTTLSKIAGPTHENAPPFHWEFFHNEIYVGGLALDMAKVVGLGGSDDTYDASNCLAILRDCKGEDWDIYRTKLEDGSFLWSCGPALWDASTLEHHESTVLEHHESTVSRIDATTKAVMS